MLSNLKKELGLNPKPSCVHLCIYDKLVNKDSVILQKYMHTNIMKKEDLKLLFSKFFPAKHFNSFFDEMEAYGLIKDLNKRNFEVIIK